MIESELRSSCDLSQWVVDKTLTTVEKQQRILTKHRDVHVLR